MKKALITSVVLATASAAALPSAMGEEPSIEVAVPADMSDTAAAAAYKAELTDAIRDVCRKAASPIIGLGYYAMVDCIERTTQKIAEEEPTGVLKASYEQPTRIALAE